MRPTVAVVNLNSIAHNLQEVRRLIPDQTKIMAIVKANAYGHGSGPVARRALDAGADYLGVALLSEAVELREYGLKCPILILGYTPEAEYAVVINNNLTQTIYTYDQAELLSQAAKILKSSAKIHLKIDTGMGRIGFQPDKQAVEIIKSIAQLPALEIEGVYTHLAKADARDKSYSHLQLMKFLWVCRAIEKAGIKVAIKHAANSAAIIDLPEAHLNMVRPGIILYGLYPSEDVDMARVDLHQAMSLKTRIVHLKKVREGTCIGYGCSYTTRKTAKIATLPLGYADGYCRLLSNQGVALVRGQRVPVVGRICMDQCMIDVSEVDGAAPGDEVVLFGNQGEGFITIDEIARQIGTINYEVVCMVSYRVPRKYI